MAEIARNHENNQKHQLQPTPFTMNMLFSPRGTHHGKFGEHFTEAANRLLHAKIPIAPKPPSVVERMRQRMGSKGHVGK